MSATKRSISMDEELYAHVLKRTRELKLSDKGSRFIQELIRKDMMAETQHEARPSVSKKKLHPRRN